MLRKRLWHPTRLALVVSILTTWVATPASAQRLSSVTPVLRVEPNALTRPKGGTNPVSPLFLQVVRRPDHRWEGLIIGGLTVGILGAAAGSQLCHLSDSTNQHCLRTSVGLGLLGAFTGGITGGLIGGAIPKASPTDSIPGSTDSIH